MKVSVYKLDDGELAVLVESAPGKGRAPVMVPGITVGNIKDKTLPVILAARAPKAPKAPRIP